MTVISVRGVADFLLQPFFLLVFIIWPKERVKTCISTELTQMYLPNSPGVQSFYRSQPMFEFYKPEAL